MTNQLTEGLQQLIGINEELTLETVTNVFDFWTDENTSYLDIIDILNETVNEYPITISYLVQALAKCSEVAVKEEYTLKEMVEFYTVTQEEKQIITTVFELEKEKDIEDTLTKLKSVELVWKDDNITLIDLIDSWNTTSNENTVSMIQLLDSFHEASAISKRDGLTVEELNTLIAYIFSTIREQGNIIGNALKSITTRISTDTVIDELNKNNITVTKDDTTMNVFGKIKNYLSKFTNEEEKSDEILKLSKIIGGNYQLSRTASIIHSM